MNNNNNNLPHGIVTLLKYIAQTEQSFSQRLDRIITNHKELDPETITTIKEFVEQRDYIKRLENKIKNLSNDIDNLRNTMRNAMGIEIPEPTIDNSGMDIASIVESLNNNED